MKIGFAALAACGLVAATAASAAPTDNPLASDSAVLRLDGIDLTTPSGQQRLAIRMDAAARAVCGDRLAAVHLALDGKARECRTQVIADIRNQIETRTATRAPIGGTQVAALR